jgi:hypothetical protein
MCLDLSGQQPGAGLRSRASTLLLIALRRSIGEHSGRCKLKFVCAHVFTSVSIENLSYPRPLRTIHIFERYAIHRYANQARNLAAHARHDHR